jgi:hypothetical protein
MGPLRGAEPSHAAPDHTSPGGTAAKTTRGPTPSEPVGVRALPPVARTAPIAPGSGSGRVDSEETRLVESLDQAVRQRDRTIESLLRSGRQAPLPTPRERQGAEAVVLKDHAVARQELRDVLANSGLTKNSAAKTDVLDRAGAHAQQVQASALVAENLLAIAECAKDLAGGPEGTNEDVKMGSEALAQIDASRLEDGDFPRFLYMRLWFHLEGLRRNPPQGTARTKALEEANAMATELVNRAAASPLAQHAMDLVAAITATLPAPPSAPSAPTQNTP